MFSILSQIFGGRVAIEDSEECVTIQDKSNIYGSTADNTNLIRIAYPVEELNSAVKVEYWEVNQN